MEPSSIGTTGATALIGSPRKKVLYFTCVAFGNTDNGGSLVCRHHIEALSRQAGIELHVCFLADQAHEAESSKYVTDLGAVPHALPMIDEPFPPTRGLRKLHPAHLWPFTYEDAAGNYPSLDRALQSINRFHSPDIVIVDYLLSARLVLRALSEVNRLVVITLNREAQFYEQLRRLRRLPPGASSSRAASLRLWFFERAVYKSCDMVIALAPGDLPLNVKKEGRGRTIAPFITPSARRWTPRPSKSILFVGNVAHYPNYLAVEWLASNFASHLAFHLPEARIRIIGSTPQDADARWQRDNIDLLGIGDRELVLRELAGCSLFMAPIQNSFGSKIKILECFSQGTPVLATKDALSGIPFREELETFDLSAPEKAAIKCQLLLTDGQTLADMGDKQCRLYRQMGLDNALAWTSVINDPLFADEVAALGYRKRRARLPSYGGGYSVWNCAH